VFFSFYLYRALNKALLTCKVKPLQKVLQNILASCNLHGCG